MDRESTFLLAIGMLIAASLVVGVSGWILFFRQRRQERAARSRIAASADQEP
jgi:hypothetical protein